MRSLVRPRRSLLFIGGAAIAVLLTACGDDDGASAEGGGADETSTSAPTPTAPSSTTEPSTSETSTSEALPSSAGEQLFPDVIGVEVEANPAGSFRFDVTISSPYDTAERYADAWRVVGPDGTVFGVRQLAHDHGAEQPFTRSLGAVEIPEDVTVVVVEGRDQANGWGGATMEVELPAG